MGIFDRFKRKNDSVLPSEVDDYYKNEFKDRRSSSVLMALLALAITLIVAAGLYFGSRTLYRTFNDDSGNTTQQGTENNDKKEAQQKETAPTNSPPQNSTDNSSPAAPSSGSGNSTAPTNNDPAPTPSTGDMPATGDSELPHTGDEGM